MIIIERSKKITTKRNNNSKIVADKTSENSRDRC